MLTKKIKAIRYLEQVPQHVYNIRVADNHNYFANNILVHNCDDPNNIYEVHSPVIRERTNDFWSSTMGLRDTNILTSRRIIIMQRAHANDLSGHVLSDPNHNYVHLCLPAEFEKAQKCVTVPLRRTNGKKWEDPRSKENEQLWPQRWKDTGLALAKLRLRTTYNRAAQLQQRPAPEGGGIIQKSWFKKWNKPLPTFDITLQSWDCAFMRDPGESKKPNPSYSACTTWGMFVHEGSNHVMLLDMWQGMVEFYELKQKAKELFKEFDADEILVEAKASGISLITELRRGGLPATRFDPSKYSSKVARARAAVCVIEPGRVWVPMQPPKYKKLYDFADVFLEACSLFPNGESNDIVDSMSQAIIKLSTSGYLYQPDEEPPIYQPTFYKSESIYD